MVTTLYFLAHLVLNHSKDVKDNILDKINDEVIFFLMNFKVTVIKLLLSNFSLVRCFHDQV